MVLFGGSAVQLIGGFLLGTSMGFCLLVPFCFPDDRFVRTLKTRRPGCATRLFVLNTGPGQGGLVIADRIFLGFH